MGLSLGVEVHIAWEKFAHTCNVCKVNVSIPRDKANTERAWNSHERKSNIIPSTSSQCLRVTSTCATECNGISYCRLWSIHSAVWGHLGELCCWVCQHPYLPRGLGTLSPRCHHKGIIHGNARDDFHSALLELLKVFHVARQVCLQTGRQGNHVMDSYSHMTR